MGRETKTTHSAVLVLMARKYTVNFNASVSQCPRIRAVAREEVRAVRGKLTKMPSISSCAQLPFSSCLPMICAIARSIGSRSG